MAGMRSMEMMGHMDRDMRGQADDRWGCRYFIIVSYYLSSPSRSCVVIVHNLAMGEMNCDRLFNLVCQYGNVSKIFFMKVRSILMLQ